MKMVKQLNNKRMILYCKIMISNCQNHNKMNKILAKKTKFHPIKRLKINNPKILNKQMKKIQNYKTTHKLPNHLRTHLI